MFFGAWNTGGLGLKLVWSLWMVQQCLDSTFVTPFSQTGLVVFLQGVTNSFRRWHNHQQFWGLDHDQTNLLSRGLHIRIQRSGDTAPWCVRRSTVGISLGRTQAEYSGADPGSNYHGLLGGSTNGTETRACIGPLTHTARTTFLASSQTRPSFNQQSSRIASHGFTPPQQTITTSTQASSGS